MSETVLEVKGLYKKFCLSLKRSMLYGTLDVTRNMFGIPYRTDRVRKGEFWALQDVSFELKEGDTLGILGTNGSGKSTLLRMLTGIFPPDQGKISVAGRVGALIAVGAGFHPHMTGRENIYLNGTILGMSKKEIDSKFDSIVSFAETGDFLDAPINTYSSGMKVRLGFAVAIHCKPDILLIDEVLSVGDLSFRNKCLRYMHELREQAKGVIFISHNLEQVRNLCNRVIILNKGSIVYDGSTHEGCVMYQELSREIRFKGLGIENQLKDRISSKDDIIYEDMGLLDQDNKRIYNLETSQTLNIFCDFVAKKDIENIYFSVSVHSENLENKNCIWVINNDNNKATFDNVKKGKYRILVNIDSHHLAPQIYTLNIAMRNGLTGEVYERLLSNVPFEVKSNSGLLERGIINVSEKWALSMLD